MNDQRQMKKLRETARELAIVKPDGDARKRETWEQAIELHIKNMGLSSDCAYNPVLRTVMLAKHSDYEIIGPALELIRRHCCPFTSKRRSELPIDCC